MLYEDFEYWVQSTAKEWGAITLTIQACFGESDQHAYAFPELLAKLSDDKQISHPSRAKIASYLRTCLLLSLPLCPQQAQVGGRLVIYFVNDQRAVRA